MDSIINQGDRDTSAQSDPTPPDPALTLCSLIERAEALLAELSTLTTHLQNHPQHSTQHHPIEIRPLRSNITAELRSLCKLSAKLDEVPPDRDGVEGEDGAETAGVERDVRVAADEDEVVNHHESRQLQELQELPFEESTRQKLQKSIRHSVRSSNIPFHEALWSTAKRSRHVLAFQKRFYYQRRNKKESVLIDIVANGGEEWIKVSTITQTRLLFEMAKMGWNQDSDDEDDLINLLGGRKDRPGDDDDDDDDDDEDTIPLLKTLRAAAKASKSHRVNYKTPRIHLVLPSLCLPLPEPLTHLMRLLSQTGAEISTANSPFLQSPIPPMSAVLQTLPTDPFANLGPIVNIDCTILLALVSDLTHAPIESEDWFHAATRRQVEQEERECLLVRWLYPALEGREMVCTREAAERMHEIVETIGTCNEKARAALLVPDLNTQDDIKHEEEETEQEKFQADLRQKWQALSSYPTSPSFTIPIHILSHQEEHKASVPLPAVAAKVAASLISVNPSVFLAGWRRGWTTVTSNRTVVKQIEAIVESDAGRDHVRGPEVWVCVVARSLVGREKVGRGKTATKDEEEELGLRDGLGQNEAKEAGS